MQRPKEKGCIGPTTAEVVRCDPADAVPPAPARPFGQCVRGDQVAGVALDRRWADTKWILYSDGPVAPDHFLTTHRHSFAEPGACPRPGARRARLLWHYLLHRHALRVGQEAVAPPEVEPYATEYTDSFVKAGFRPALEVELATPDQPPSEADARHPLYDEPPCSYWYQKQMLPPRPPRGACWDRVTAREAHDRLQPFRRNALFTAPVESALHEPPAEAEAEASRAPPCKPPRHAARVDHAVTAPYNTAVM